MSGFDSCGTAQELHLIPVFLLLITPLIVVYHVALTLYVVVFASIGLIDVLSNYVDDAAKDKGRHCHRSEQLAPTANRPSANRVFPSHVFTV